MADWSDISKKLPQLFARYKYVLLVVIVGVALLLWPSSGPDGKESETPASAETVAFSVEELEARLEKALSAAKGVGRVRIVLTLKTDMEVLLSQDESVSQRREWNDGQLSVYDTQSDTKTVMGSDSSSGGEPVVVGRVYPEFKGALIVCDGGGDPAVRLQIVEAVSALTGLGSDKITVAPMEPDNEP